MKTVYHHTEEIHNLHAPREIIPLVLKLVDARSVLDIGCGTGTWLKAFHERGVEDIMGVDGDFLDKSLLKINADKFLANDLQQSFSLGRKFDLALSLEVAEHLDSNAADRHVDTLVSHADTILFSAAIPGQGGQNHINEQWPEYWQNLFAKRGYYFHDVIRPVIWNNNNVDWWYRQNIFLVTREKPSTEGQMISVVHPMHYDRTIRLHQQYVNSLSDGRQGLRISSKIFCKALIYKVRSLFKGQS